MTGPGGSRGPASRPPLSCGEAGGHRGTFLGPPERGVAAALALGAQAVSLGTAFLACPESGASRAYKEALLARGLRNRFTEAMADAPLLPFPLQNALTADLRREAAKAGKADLLSLWAGQAAPLARVRGAGDLVRDLVRETEEAVARLAGGA